MHQPQGLLDVLLHRQYHHRHHNRRRHGGECPQDPDILVQEDPRHECFRQQNLVSD